MINNTKAQRVGVFYDGNFLLHVSNYYSYIHWQHKRLNISGLHRFIEERVAQEQGLDGSEIRIAQACYFRGRLNATEALARGNQLYNDRVFDDILMSEGVQTFYLPLRNMFGRREERGTDVWLSLEAYERVLTGQLDMVVLIVSDTDYVPLIRKLIAQGVKVMLLGWEFDFLNDQGQKCVTKTSHELLSLASYPIAMHEVIESGLENENSIINDIFIGGAAPYNPEIVAQWNSLPKQRYEHENAIVLTEDTVNVDKDGMLISVARDAESDLADNDDPDDTSNNRQRQVSQVLSVKSGYGFIRYPNNNLFFHSADVKGCDFTVITPGTIVSFVVERSESGQEVAKMVTLMSE